MATTMEQQQQREQQHAWEQTDAAQMWSAVQEDADGNLLNSSHQRDAAALVRLRRRRLARGDSARSHRRLVRDMIRYVYVVLDCSHVMYERDPAPPGGGQTRFDVVLNVLSAFVQEYYDQNPLGQLGLVVVRDGEAEMVARLTGSRTAHGAALVRLRRDVGRSVASDPHGAGGVFSLQNGLEVAGRSLGHMPRYGSREVLVVLGGLATCDPGDVLADTLPPYCSPAYQLTGSGLGSSEGQLAGLSLYPAYVRPLKSYRGLPGGSRSHPRLRLPMQLLRSMIGVVLAEDDEDCSRQWPMPSSGPMVSPRTVRNSL